MACKRHEEGMGRHEEQGDRARVTLPVAPVHAS
jgi:hypothetical protein